MDGVRLIPFRIQPPRVSRVSPTVIVLWRRMTTNIVQPRENFSALQPDHLHGIIAFSPLTSHRGLELELKLAPKRGSETSRVGRRSDLFFFYFLFRKSLFFGIRYICIWGLTFICSHMRFMGKGGLYPSIQVGQY